MAESSHDNLSSPQQRDAASHAEGLNRVVVTPAGTRAHQHQHIDPRPPTHKHSHPSTARIDTRRNGVIVPPVSLLG